MLKRNVPLHYSTSSKSWNAIVEHLKARLYHRLTRDSSLLFLKGRDIISTAPQVSGEHEPLLSDFIRKCAKHGYSDFLIDIGANIGLISCQTGAHFDMVHMFEPNPLCVQILSVNALISLEQRRFQVHPVGIGTQLAELTLTVPKHNWGGAFVNGGDNAYSDEVLAQKDGFSSFDVANYFEMKVTIADGIVKLAEVFGELHKDAKTAGVIKIDVEGLEAPILKAIARTLPDDAKVVIVFENWDRYFDPKPLLDAFDGRARLQVFERRRPWPDGASDLRKAMGLLFGRRLRTELVPWEQATSLMGDLVLDVAARDACFDNKD